MNDYEDNKKNREGVIHLIKFTLFSISAGLIQVGSFAIFHDVFKIERWSLSYLPALILSVLWNFTFNRKFTFKSAANVPIAMFKVGMYYLVFTPLSSWWGDALEIIGWPDYVVLIFTMVINFTTEFMYTKYFVYRNQINTAVEKTEETI